MEFFSGLLGPEGHSHGIPDTRLSRFPGSRASRLGRGAAAQRWDVPSVHLASEELRIPLRRRVRRVGSADWLLANDRDGVTSTMIYTHVLNLVPAAVRGRRTIFDGIQGDRYADPHKMP